jgi:PilX N-terminal
MVKRARTSERGATIFVVVLVLTMLTAIGIFAVRAATMAAATSGYERENTQNHYVSEYGLHAAITELGTDQRNAYFEAMSNGKDTCAATKGLAYADGGVVPCYHLYAKDIQGRLSNTALFTPASTAADGGSTVVPGSLGPTALDGDFVVEMTDPGPVGVPVAGSDQGGTGPKLRYVQVTLTSTGQVRPTADVAACDDKSASIAGNDSSRAFVVIGPMP